MTKIYLYRAPDGTTVEMQYQLDAQLYPDHEFMGEKPEPVFHEPTYDWLRRRAYPPIEAQMDMLWHAMHTGTTPKVEPFYSEILAVKQKHPKPSN